MLTRNPHRPAHLLLDNTSYFLTGAIYEKRPLLADPLLKERFISLLADCFRHYAWQLHEWVVLDNHYHVLGQSAAGKDLPTLMSRLHSLSARFIQSAVRREAPIWWNYWDYCPRDEKDYYVRQNYLFNNPLKHGYVTDLKDYPFSSFQRFLEASGRETAVRRFKQYPDYRGLKLAEDDF